MIVLSAPALSDSPPPACIVNSRTGSTRAPPATAGVIGMTKERPARDSGFPSVSLNCSSPYQSSWVVNG